MGDYSFLQSPTSKSPKPTSFFFNSPRLFSGFSSKGLFEIESSIMSPTSILDAKPLCGFKNPLFSEANSPKVNTESEHKRYWENLDSKKVGLGIVDDLIDEKSHDPNFPNQESRMVMFGSQLRIQIPPMPNSVFYPIESPKLPPDFGIKSRNSKLGSFSPSLSPSSFKKYPFGSSSSGIETLNSGIETSNSGIETSNSGIETSNSGIETLNSGLETSNSGIETSNSGIETSNSGIETLNSGLETSSSGIDTLNSTGGFTGYLSGSEAEVSEESICMISQVPNSKTSHIFENCIVEGCCGVVGFWGSRVENGFVGSPSSFPSESFLSYCFTCRKKLGHGKDIFMYRGEKAFCSSECRYQEMLLEDEMEKYEYDNGGYGAPS